VTSVAGFGPAPKNLQNPGFVAGRACPGDRVWRKRWQASQPDARDKLGHFAISESGSGGLVPTITGLP